ncbi:MAG TPA: hypothetical protein V6C72_10315 [Chroococcales cyanobacterium]
MQFKGAGKGKWKSAEGYTIKGNPDDGYEAFTPDGKMIVFWSIDIPHAKESCEDHFKKNKE